MQSLNLIPLGGIGTITRNMYVYEYQNQLLIVDCGIGFPDASMLGVDLLIPDIRYLQDRQNDIIGMILTHGHDDHIAGLPYILPQIGVDVPIYGSKLTLGFAHDRLKEFGIKANFIPLSDKTLQLGAFTIDNIKMTHSVPDARHFVIRTPGANVYHGTDFKFDLNPIDGVRPDLQKIASLSRQYPIDVLLSDCLNAEVTEFSSSESSLIHTFQQEMRGVSGQVIVTVMSSNVHRIQSIAEVAQEYGRKVAFVGRSIEQNVSTAQKLGFLKLPNNIISKRSIKKYKPYNVCIVIAGSQGQVGSSLSRAALGEHSQVTITKSDKVIFASDPIPGNEQDVYATIDAIARIGSQVTYSDIVDNVHVSGHSSAIEQKILINLTNPKHIIPIGGSYHHMIQYRRNATSMGIKQDNIHLLENGQIFAITKKHAAVTDTIELKNIMVDGLGVGDIGNIVLRDRQRMSADGILIVVVPVSQQTGQVNGEIEIISRGFVYLKESQDLIDKVRQSVSDALSAHAQVVSGWHQIRKRVEQQVEKITYQETQRQPLILTVVMEV